MSTNVSAVTPATTRTASRRGAQPPRDADAPGHRRAAGDGSTVSTNAPVQSRNPLNAVRCARTLSESISQKYGMSSARICWISTYFSRRLVLSTSSAAPIEQLVDRRVAVTGAVRKRERPDVRRDIDATNADVRIRAIAERRKSEIEGLFHEHLIDRGVEVERLEVHRDADISQLLAQRLRQPLLIGAVRECDGESLAVRFRFQPGLVQQLACRATSCGY